jgi:hypothetical protein
MMVLFISFMAFYGANRLTLCAEAWRLVYEAQQEHVHLHGMPSPASIPRLRSEIVFPLPSEFGLSSGLTFYVQYVELTFRPFKVLQHDTV